MATNSQIAFNPQGKTVVVAAFGKELWDAHSIPRASLFDSSSFALRNLGHGTPDRIDALATVAGGCAMLGWLLLMAPLITKII